MMLEIKKLRPARLDRGAEPRFQIKCLEGTTLPNLVIDVEDLVPPSQAFGQGPVQVMHQDSRQAFPAAFQGLENWELAILDLKPSNYTSRRHTCGRDAAMIDESK